MESFLAHPDRRRAAAFLFVASLAVAQLLAAPGHYLGQEHDDAQYALAAVSLTHGRYDLGVVPSRAPLTAVTPGWPLLLVPAAAVSKDAPWGYEIWSWAWLALCDGLIWIWFSRRAGPAVAGGAAALFSLNPLVLSRSGVVMSEIPYLAVTLIALLALDSWPGWAMGLLLALAWLIRPAAWAFFPAVWAYYLYKRRWRDVAGCLVAVAVPLGLWSAWVSRSGDRLAEFSEMALMLHGRPLGEVLAMAGENIRHALALWGASSLPWPPAGYSALGLAWGVILACAAMWGVVMHVREQGYDPAAGYLFCGACMHAFWPWWYERYLPPFLPFLIWGLWKCLASLTDRRRAVQGRSPSAQAAVLLALAVLVFAGQGWRLLRADPGRSRPELIRTYAWIRANTPPYALFSSALYCRDAFYAGRPFVPLPGPGSLRPASSERRLSLAEVLTKRKVRYVLWQKRLDLGSSLGARFPWTVALESLEKELARPAFREVYAEPREGAAVYEVTKVTPSAPLDGRANRG